MRASFARYVTCSAWAECAPSSSRAWIAPRRAHRRTWQHPSDNMSAPLAMRAKNHYRVAVGWVISR
eukprot:9494451-Pyramimonas_sp.AAC.1